jgi:hypothetical protein
MRVLSTAIPLGRTTLFHEASSVRRGGRITEASLPFFELNSVDATDASSKNRELPEVYLTEAPWVVAFCSRASSGIVSAVGRFRSPQKRYGRQTNCNTAADQVGEIPRLVAVRRILSLAQVEGCIQSVADAAVNRDNAD